MQDSSGKVSDEAIQLAAEEAYTNLKGTQCIDDLRKYVTASVTGVPYNADVELLRKFKTMNGRFATIYEKTKLRKTLIGVFKKRGRERYTTKVVTR